ncbi:transmembrane protein 132C [Phyllostomus discolor]|uniref:Transmembrane protein 132C n=1 Tax=Phyllostomus discolor TaxID=89673 RepID=A0A7E6CXL9_9CHIR|nr:transmembrane protein 132C [Phyllostomus discolor]
MRFDGAAPGPAAPLCGALSLVLGALLGRVTEGRGAPDGGQQFSSLPPYLPVSYRVLGAETAFFLQEARRDPSRNCSLRARAESFFTYRARGPPRLSASYGPFSVEKAVPLDWTSASNSLGPADQLGFGWTLKAHVLQDRIYPARPTVQVLFHVVGRDWAEGSPAEQLPCLRVFAFRETRAVRGGCRPSGELGLCVAELRLPAGWFGAPAVVAGRRKPGPAAEGSTVELYYAVHAGEEPGDCASGDAGKGNAIRPGKGGLGDSLSHLQRVGAVGLCQAPDSSDHQLSELRLDGNVAVWLPSRQVRPGDVVTAYVTVAGNATVDLFILRAKVRKGVSILSARTSEPQQWDVRQEVGDAGKHATATVVCRRLGPSTRDRGNASPREVVQVDFQVASASGLSGTQPVSWQVEYPLQGATAVAASEIFVSQRDLVGIVPLAMDTELLNTAILTGKTVTLPVKVVSVEENGAVADISESVECRSADEDIVKVSDRCDCVFVNGKEVKGKVDAVVTFTYQHLRAPLHVTVWAPRLPLQIEVSDTELSQVKGWRVPLVASRRPAPDSEDEEEEERRGRGCALQYQRATVRVLTQFVSEGAGPWGQPSHLLGPDWQVDVTHLVADFMKVEEPHVAALQDGGRVLVGREVGMTTIQVLSPLSDSILAEKTVTVLDDRVSLADLALQLVAGLSVTLHPGADSRGAVTAVATAEERLRAPKQEAVVSTWLQFSDGAATPLDIYDPEDFTLTATSLDEAVVSVPQARSPWRPVVVAEGEGQGPLLRVDLAIGESCQKSKRKSVLAAGVANVRVKFGQNDVDPSPGGGGDGSEAEVENHASDRRPEGQDPERAGQGGLLPGSPSLGREEGARRGGPTARSLLDNPVAENSRLDGGWPPREAPLPNIPIDVSDFPAPADLPRAGAGPGARGLSDLQIGMYALLGVFCLAILVFLANCAAFALRYRHKQAPLEGPASVTHSHDWVWLGNEAELLEAVGQGPPPPDEHTTVLDRGPGACADGSRLLLNGGSSPSQGPRPPAESGGRRGRDQKQEPLRSPACRRKKVKFASFPAAPPDDGCPNANCVLGGHDEDIKWVCRDLGLGAPGEPRNCLLEKLKDKV